MHMHKRNDFSEASTVDFGREYLPQEHCFLSTVVLVLFPHLRRDHQLVEVAHHPVVLLLSVAVSSRSFTPVGELPAVTSCKL